MAFLLKAVGYGLGALLAVGGMGLITLGTTTGNASAVSQGWTLVAISVVMWSISLISRKL